jgi:hypothetical protein
VDEESEESVHCRQSNKDWQNQIRPRRRKVLSSMEHCNRSPFSIILSVELEDLASHWGKSP